jgi:hypothetical protein
MNLTESNMVTEGTLPHIFDLYTIIIILLKQTTRDQAAV